MKRIVSVLLAVCMCLSVGVMLTACDGGHAHTYNEEWAKDATHHWHACEGEGCTDIADKAEHSYGDWASAGNARHEKACECGAKIVEDHDWNDGEITTAPTATSKGVMTYKCKQCEYTYTSDIDKITTTVTDAEWESALDLRAKPHVMQETLRDHSGATSTSTIKYSVDIVCQSRRNASGKVTAEAYYYIKDEKCYFVAGQLPMGGGDDLVYKKNEITIERFHTLNDSLNNLAAKFPKENFVYDEETYEYHFTGTLKVDGYDVADATVRFENGRVVCIELHRTDKENRDYYNEMVFIYEVPQIDIPKTENSESNSASAG